MGLKNLKYSFLDAFDFVGVVGVNIIVMMRPMR